MALTHKIVLIAGRHTTGQRHIARFTLISLLKKIAAFHTKDYITAHHEIKGTRK